MNRYGIPTWLSSDLKSNVLDLTDPQEILETPETLMGMKCNAASCDLCYEDETEHQGMPLGLPVMHFAEAESKQQTDDNGIEILDLPGW